MQGDRDSEDMAGAGQERGPWSEHDVPCRSRRLQL